MPFRLRFRLALATAVAALGACAPRLDAIPPAALPFAYSALDCAAARAEAPQARATLAELSAAQPAAATGDALGVFLLGVPVSSLAGGDRAGLIAARRRMLALDARVAACGEGRA